jgi:hypothetical protein
MPAWITSELRELDGCRALRLQHHDLAAAHGQPARDGKANDAGADHRALNPFCHDSSGIRKARKFTTPEHRKW